MYGQTVYWLYQAAKRTQQKLFNEICLCGFQRMTYWAATHCSGNGRILQTLASVDMVMMRWNLNSEFAFFRCWMNGIGRITGTSSILLPTSVADTIQDYFNVRTTYIQRTFMAYAFAYSQLTFIQIQTVCNMIQFRMIKPFYWQIGRWNCERNATTFMKHEQNDNWA